MHDNLLLHIRDVKKYFPIKNGFLRRSQSVVKALDGINLSICEGKTMGLVGESGCGKSTLGRCIVRLETTTEGSITFKGEDISGLSAGRMKELRKEVQMVFQDPYSSLNPRKTIEQIILEPFIIHDMYDPPKRRKKVLELLDIVGLRSDMAKRYPHELSGGQRQRISIARALALRPKLIVADEPVSGLDVSIQAQILNLLMDLQEEFGLTYLFISHDLSVVRHVCDNVAVMYLGHIVEEASKETIFNNPSHPYTKALIRSVPIPDPKIDKDIFVLEGDVPSPLSPPSGCPFNPRCDRRQDVCTRDFPTMEETIFGSRTSCHFPIT